MSRYQKNCAKRWPTSTAHTWRRPTGEPEIDLVAGGGWRDDVPPRLKRRVGQLAASACSIRFM